MDGADGDFSDLGDVGAQCHLCTPIFMLVWFLFSECSETNEGQEAIMRLLARVLVARAAPDRQ